MTQSDRFLITSEQQQISGIYVGLMTEIRDRLQSIDRSRHTALSVPMFGQDYLAAEYAMLQLRMICELIALACVVAHGDLEITRSGKFKRDFAADLIFRKLSEHHPDFFPDPVISVPGPNGFPDLQSRKNAMSKDEMIHLYRYCLDRLHRGKVKDILKGSKRIYNYDYLHESITKLSWLLDQHTIALFREDQRKAWVQMDCGGAVRWMWMVLGGRVRPGEGPPA